MIFFNSKILNVLFMVVIIASMLFFGFSSDSNGSGGDKASNVEVPASANNLERFIADHEGFSATAYRGIDAQNLTIGYGHVIKPGDGLSATSVISDDQALQLMAEDIADFTPYVDEAFEGYTMTSYQRDAMIDFAYGEGVAPFTDNWSIISDVKGYLTGSVTADELKSSFLDYTTAGGEEGALTSRRTDEWNLFCNGDYGFPSASSNQ